MDERHPPTPHEARLRALALIDQQPRRPGAIALVDWLDRLCGALATELDLMGAAVALSAGSGGAGSVLAASDSSSRRTAELVDEVGEGPALDAVATGRPVLVPMLGGEIYGAWPGYTSAAASLGARAVFCFPLQVGAARLGVLTVFGAEPTQLGSRSLSTCMTMAELATERLLDSDTEPDVSSALGVRSEVYQAQGMVAASLGVGLVEALARMRGHAFAADRPLLDVAIDIVHRRVTLNDDPGSP